MGTERIWLASAGDITPPAALVHLVSIDGRANGLAQTAGSDPRSGPGSARPWGWPCQRALAVWLSSCARSLGRRQTRGGRPLVVVYGPYLLLCNSRRSFGEQTKSRPRRGSCSLGAGQSFISSPSPSLCFSLALSPSRSLALSISLSGSCARRSQTLRPTLEICQLCRFLLDLGSGERETCPPLAIVAQLHNTLVDLIHFQPAGRPAARSPSSELRHCSGQEMAPGR